MATSSQPLISIVIPTYEMKGQGLTFLKRCLSSIERQIDIDPQAIEIIVSDQSTDSVIEDFCKNQKKIIGYFRTTTGRGIAAHNLNIGIAKATGKYIKILFQDDVLVEDIYLSNIRNIILKYGPECILTGALHTADGQNFTNPISPKNNPYFLFGNNTVSSPSVITIQSIAANTFRFDEHLKMLFDCEFYYRLFNNEINVIMVNHIHIANGIWHGQSQHQIDHKQFTKEVRYLNWKHPQAKMIERLKDYQAEFHRLHPNAQLPFSKKIDLFWLKRIYYDYLKQIGQIKK